MKGFMIKDFKLMKNQGRLMLVFCFLVFLFVVTGISDASFLVSALPFVISIFAMTTLSYDDLDNGMAFLMTLPITRKEYVKGKYLIAVLVGGGVWILCSILGMGYERISNPGGNLVELFGLCLGSGLFLSLFLGMLIPIQVKFGSEKGRVILYGSFCLLIGLVYVGSRLLSDLSVDLQGVYAFLNTIPAWAWFLALAAAIVLIFCISYWICVRIMEKKEF